MLRNVATFETRNGPHNVATAAVVTTAKVVASNFGRCKFLTRYFIAFLQLGLLRREHVAAFDTTSQDMHNDEV